MKFAYIVDLISAGAVGYTAVRGMFRGFAGEVLRMFGFVAAIFCGWTFADDGASLILEMFPELNGPLLTLGSSVAIFVGVSLLFSLLETAVTMLLRAAKLSALDHLMGAAAGALRGAAFILIGYGLITTFGGVLPTAWMADSRAMQISSVVYPEVVKFLKDIGVISDDDISQIHRSADGEILAVPSDIVRDERLAVPMRQPAGSYRREGE